MNNPGMQWIFLIFHSSIKKKKTLQASSSHKGKKAGSN